MTVHSPKYFLSSLKCRPLESAARGACLPPFAPTSRRHWSDASQVNRIALRGIRHSLIIPKSNTHKRNLSCSLSHVQSKQNVFVFAGVRYSCFQHRHYQYGYQVFKYSSSSSSYDRINMVQAQQRFRTTLQSQCDACCLSESPGKQIRLQRCTE